LGQAVIATLHPITSTFKGGKEMRKHILVVMTAIFVLALATVAMAGDDPHNGTWKMNTAKSKFNLGPPPKSDTITFTVQDNSISGVEIFVPADGKAYNIKFAAKYDGNDYSYVGAPHIETIAFRKIDVNTFGVVLKKEGKVVARAQEVFSKDGKTFTITEKGKDPKGQEYSATYFYEKQ
jgi:hypothetical protein